MNSERQEGTKGNEHGGEREPTFQPRIYVADLAAYNNGQLHGGWLDADQEPEALLAGISEMLAASPMPGAEEWAIHDHEGFCGAWLSEHEDIATVSKLALGITEHGPAFGAWANYLGVSGYAELDRFEDCYQGRWDSLTDYAEQFLDALGLPEIIERAVPAELQAYVTIDAEGFGRDMSYNGEVCVVEDDPAGGVFIFSP